MTPGLADARRAMGDAQRQLDAADQSPDEAVKRDRYRQAAQRLGYASRVLDGLQPQGPDPHQWGQDLVLPGRGRLPGPPR